MNDTIAAIATPPGRGGVGIVRISGPNAAKICSALINAEAPQPRVATYSKFFDSSHMQIDEGLCLFFAQPKSFTGEDVLELQAHGGPIVLDMLLKRVLELGARMARAGEFSERAFLNNKMDLVQVEAVAELINAATKEAAMAATRSLQGEFSKKINTLVENITRLRMFIEAAIDFSDEEIDFLADSDVDQSLQALISDVDTIYLQAKQGILLSEGINVVIVGEPNVGKSTLLNCLTGQDTAIVTPIAGTTRDTISANINIDGLLLNVMDTAGLRDTTDVVEKEGIKRARKAIEIADLILLVIDVGDRAKDLKLSYAELFAASNAQIIVVCNKIDTLELTPSQEELSEYSMVAISAAQNEGLDLLRAEIKRVVGVRQNNEGIFAARRRHLNALDRARGLLLQATTQVKSSCCELLAEELRCAQLALSEITGAFCADDLLGKIFSEFCIGK